MRIEGKFRKSIQHSFVKINENITRKVLRPPPFAGSLKKRKSAKLKKTAAKAPNIAVRVGSLRRRSFFDVFMR